MEIWAAIGTINQWRGPDRDLLLVYLLSAKRGVEGTAWISSQELHQHRQQAAVQQPLDPRRG